MPLTEQVGGTIGRLIVDAVARFATRPAVSDDNRTLTYAELGEEIGRYITLFEDLGLAKGDGLAVLTRNRLEAWPAICAANVMGLRYTPLHPLSGIDDHAHICTDAGASALLVDAERYGAHGKDLAQRIPSLRHLLSFGPLAGARDVLAAIGGCVAAPLADRTEPEDLVWIAYTGGTTGRSKGVMLSHRAVTAMALTIAGEWEWPEPVRFGVVTPVSHAAGITIYPIMLRGGLAHFIDGFDTARFCCVVEERQLNSVFLVPTLIYSLLDAEAVRSRHDLSSLELVVYGAAPIAPDRLRRAIEVFGPIFLQLYGQTEAPQVITTLRKSDHDLARPHLLGSCGLPGTLSTVRLLDENLQEVPAGTAGEICVRGPLCCSGYWNQPALTQELFRGGWLHTGDVAVRDAQGYLYIVDRTKDLIISGGVNVYPREVEDAIMAHPAVDRAGVVGLPHETWGEAVSAFVILRPGSVATVEELQAHVKALRGGPWTPKTISFCDRLPLTPLGKLDRRALREPHWVRHNRRVG